ncbi:MAG TPA: hypothetical protein VNO34_01485 [Actinomycetota bacterium]|nr:hypothetical protein [Actinomycetota bacterium]
MSILDRAKQAAQQVATAAKKGAEQVKEKVEDVQLRRKADDAAKRLGYLIYRERAEGVPAGEEADRLVKEIGDLERQIREEAPRSE